MRERVEASEVGGGLGGHVGEGEPGRACVGDDEGGVHEWVVEHGGFLRGGGAALFVLGDEDEHNPRRDDGEAEHEEHQLVYMEHYFFMGRALRACIYRHSAFGGARVMTEADILENAWQTDRWSIPHVLFFFVGALLGTTWRDTLLLLYFWKALEALPWVDIVVAPDALIVDPLEALYGWYAVLFLRRFGSPFYAVRPLECRGADWWRVVILAFLPLIAQTAAKGWVEEADAARMLGIGEHRLWGLSFAWALGVVYACSPRRWARSFTWSVIVYFIVYYGAQLLAYSYVYNGWFLASWLHLGLLAADGWLLLFHNRPTGYHSEA